MRRNTTRILLIAFAIGFALCTNGQAQEKTVRKGNQQWLQYYAQLKLSERWNLMGDAGYRWRDGFDIRTQYILRMGIGYKPVQGLQFAGGLAHTGTYGQDGLSRVEFRPYQDLALKNEFRYFDLGHRIRVEERFFKPVQDGRIQGSGTFNFRFRYSLMATIPLFGLSEGHPDRKLLLIMGDEIFLNAGNEILTNVFDQNRVLLSPTLQWNKHNSLSLTWNHLYGSTTDPFTYVRTNVMWLQWRQQFDISKKTPAP